MNNKIFTEIPMRTWNWLGVNEAKIDENIDIKEQIINVGDGESRQIVEINLSDETAANKYKIKAAVSSHVEFIFIDVGGADSFSELEIELEGNESTADVAAVYLGDNNRKIDINYIIRQRGKQTNAKMDVKGALSGNSEKVFRGTLDFIQGAKGSIGHENEEVIILSPNVRNRSVPLMLSHEDDVDGHHAVSVGRIDENKLFYLMSRGLDKVEAEKLIVEAAFNPVLERLDDEQLKNKIYETIQRRLSNV